MNSGKLLQDHYDEHADKVSDKWSLYLEAYEHYLSPFRDKDVSLLEIGAQNGGSLEIWAKYFSNARVITGVDINPDCANLTFDDARIRLLVGDASTEETSAQLFETVGSSFDIIIDDGSHRSSDIVKSFATYFPRLAPGGIYLMEDVHCSYWVELQGGLYNPLSSISFGKKLVDLCNHEHWRENLSREKFLDAFASAYDTSFADSDLDEIDSVEFSNSLIAVHKGRWQTKGLGRRQIAGQNSSVIAASVLTNKSIDQLRAEHAEPVAWTQPIELVVDGFRAEAEALRSRVFEAEAAAQTGSAQLAHVATLGSAVMRRIIDRNLDLAVLSSGLFDVDYYRAQSSLPLASQAELVRHYLSVGEHSGLRPSESFDPAFYAQVNPDVVADGFNMLLHYISHGQWEGRPPVTTQVVSAEGT
ncbi:class I SAM-dependent methyltransferase [Devosia sp. A449]